MTMISATDVHEYISPDSFTLIIYAVGVKMHCYVTYHWLSTAQLMKANWLF